MRKSGTFRVHVTKDYLVFASAHFITFPGHRCEKLHGHNYRVGAAVEGLLAEDAWYVLDFSELKRIMRLLCDEIDHVVLLPTENPHVRVEEQSDSVHVSYDGAPRYVFPRRDCALLPIPNTTVEMLALYLAGRARTELQRLSLSHLSAVEIEVEENFGQSATYRELLDRTGRLTTTESAPDA